MNDEIKVDPATDFLEWWTRVYPLFQVQHATKTHFTPEEIASLKVWFELAFTAGISKGVSYFEIVAKTMKRT